MHKYTIRRAIANDIVISKHRTYNGAVRALARQCAGAEAFGGYSTDYLYDEQRGARVPLDPLLYTEEQQDEYLEAK